MRHRTHGRPALETRVDYVESKLDESIARFDESRKDFKEAMQKLESKFDESRKDFKEAMQQMENRHQANFSRLETSLDKVIIKAESSRRWAIGTVVTIAIAVIGSLVTFIVFLLNNGFQVPS